MSMQFEFCLAQPERVETAAREGRRLRDDEVSDFISIAEPLDPLSWLEAFEEALEEVVGIGPRLERDGREVYPAAFAVAAGWVDRIAALTEEQAGRIVERWANYLGESLQPGERPKLMLDDLHALMHLCRRAKLNHLAVLYAVNY